MTISAGIALLSYMLVNAFTPGPGNILALNTTTNYGWKKGRKMVFGIICGFYAVQFLCANVFFALSVYMESAMQMIQYLGVLYLLWLAWHVARSKPDISGESKEPSFFTGFFLQFANVKTYFFGMTCLAGYVQPYYQSYFAFVLTGIGIATCAFAAVLTWALLGLSIQRIYQKHYRIINMILALFLVYCAVMMVCS